MKRLEAVALDEEERSFMLAELEKPRDPADIMAGVDSPKMAQQVYAVSLMAITVDTETERTYLDDLAAGLKLTDNERAKVHSLLDIPFP